MAPSTKIPRNLIESAKNGNADDLRRLCTAVTRDNYSLSVVEAALAYLQASKCPYLPLANPENPVMRLVAGNGALAMQTVSCCIESSDRSRALQEGTATRILEELDGILLWMAFCVKIPLSSAAETVANYYQADALLLRDMIALDSRLAKAIFAQPSVADIILELWDLYDEGPATKFDAFTQFGGCSVTALLHTFVTNEQGLQTFSDRLVESASTITRVLDRLIKQQYIHLTFILEADAEDRKLYEDLVQHTCIAPETCWKGALDSAHQFDCKLAARPHTFAIIVESGAMSLLLQSMAEDKSKGSGEWDHAVFERLRRFGHFPRFLRAIGAVLQTVHPNLFSLTKHAATWRTLQAVTNRNLGRLEAGKDQSSITICDNWNLDIDHGSQSRTCSRCHSVAYCSLGCQEEDWKRRHYKECATMHITYLRRKDLDIHYTYSTRWFQTLLSTHAFEQNGGGEGFQEPPAMVPLDTFLSIGSWDRDCPAAELRRTELFESFRSQEEPTTRLVEGRYYLGDGIRLCLLLEVQPVFHVEGQDEVDDDEDDHDDDDGDDEEEEERAVEIKPGASRIVRSVVQIEFAPSIVPPEPAKEPTSTIVLTTPRRHFVDLRATLPLVNRDLYWGISGVSTYDPESRQGTWKHLVDSRSDEPQEDSGVMSMLENGDILEKGEMLDFDDGKVKLYEEIWRDVNAERGDVIWAVEVVTEGYKGSAIRIGGLCQAILKREGLTSSGRWTWTDSRTWALDFSSGPHLWETDWPALIPDGQNERVDIGNLEWVVVEYSVQ
ncbi:hypothetical protein BKA70DRAFT_1568408 [Coprinopsis sp. MPI-PUGE-AT-0042]|nr:hypothetical protein BKA70DRAFT_1568408 [Coprinopsis sp. MPI-PUGE-AT-0042]